ncbi:MAG TPA: AraC family transcriptional regulator [Steroidobacteraceae bacterium]|nr:AraC family transcriptional regulator [Steroidobacteraceae bacterium]
MSTPDARLLDEMLARMNWRARIAFRGLVCERWALGGGGQGRLGFHAVLSGTCWLMLPGATRPVEVTAGGLLIYRPETKHLLADTAFAETETPPARVMPISSAAAEREAGLLCGYFEGGTAGIPILDAMPPYLMWPNFDAFPEPLARLMRTLAACALDESRGCIQVLQNLCELLLLMLLRESGVLRVENVGVLRAQCDPVLRRVLNAMHARPGRRWTLASLARQAGMSRSAFAARFKQVTKASAMRYLRDYRLSLAERRMREEGLTADRAARVIGYRSVGAFRRAVRRR